MLTNSLKLLRSNKQKLRRLILSKRKPVLNSIKLYFYINVKKGPVTFEIRNALGIGARLVWVLEILAFCDENGIIPDFKFSYPDSLPEEDYFKKYFYIKNFTGKKGNLIRLETIGDLGFKNGYNGKLNVEYANSLIRKYLGVNDEVLEEVESFRRKKLQYENVLGIHYRATDKITEAPLVQYEAVFKNILFYLSKYPDTQAVFLSTDDKKFELYLRSVFTGKPLVVREDYFRSENDTPIHYNRNLDKYRINQDAVVNLLLLSKCQGLIKCSSMLSDLSVLFNPAINLVVLNSPYSKNLWFPAKDLLSRVSYSCI